MVRQEFVQELRNAVKEYYLPHRDKDVRLVRFLTSPEGETMLLVRFNDEHNRRLSGLLSFCPVYGPEQPATFDVREEFTVQRGDENKLIEWYTTVAGEIPDTLEPSTF